MNRKPIKHCIDVSCCMTERPTKSKNCILDAHFCRTSSPKNSAIFLRLIHIVTFHQEKRTFLIISSFVIEN